MRFMIAFSDQFFPGARDLRCRADASITRSKNVYVGRITRTTRTKIKMRKPLGHVFGLASCLFFGLGSALGQQSRPAITGVSHMCVYSSDAAATDNFYGHIVGATKGPD